MNINFSKLHACGNDYIFINCMQGVDFNPVSLAQEMSPRHTSVGADGIILACHSDIADVKMRIFNSDGSEAMMCGNGIRCLAEFVADEGIIPRGISEISIETASGLRKVNYVGDGTNSVAVEMSMHTFEPSKIPMKCYEPIVGKPLTIDDRKFKAYALSVGNPHLVLISSSVEDVDLYRINRVIQESDIFTEGVNIEVISLIDSTNIRMRVFERGSGETFSCGTGACASAIAAFEEGMLIADTFVKVHTVGGTLNCFVTKNGPAWLSGEVHKVYKGIYEYKNYDNQTTKHRKLIK